MVPEFSIKNIKADDVIKVCDIIESVTGVKVESYIMASIESGELDDFLNALNIINYLAFKTLLAVSSEKNSLQKDLLKYRN